MSEEHLSKYQRKRLAKQRGNWPTPSAQVAVNIINKLERGESVQPKPKKKPVQPPPRSALNDLGERPIEAAKWIAAAVENMQVAEKLMQECYDLGNPGVQRGEAFTILGCLRAALPRIEAIAARARHIPNNARCDRREEVKA